MHLGLKAYGHLFASRHTQISNIFFYFVLVISGKVTKSEKLSTSEVIRQKVQGGWEHPFPPVDPGVTNRPIGFKLAARTDDLKILKTILQFHWSSPTVNKRSFWRSAKADIADGTLWSSCYRGYKFEFSG